MERVKKFRIVTFSLFESDIELLNSKLAALRKTAPHLNKSSLIRLAITELPVPMENNPE